jgi:hypothetical protein
MEKLKISIVCFVRVDPTLLFMLGSPDRVRLSDTLCCAEVASATTTILDVYQFSGVGKRYFFIVSFRFLNVIVSLRSVSQAISFRIVPFLIFYVSFFPFRFLK